MPDTTIKWARIRETTEFDLGGNAQPVIIGVFYIGTHGPFTERFTREEWLDPIKKQQRVDALRATIVSLPT